jgi:hypothetical protein
MAFEQERVKIKAGYCNDVITKQRRYKYPFLYYAFVNLSYGQDLDLGFSLCILVSQVCKNLPVELVIFSKIKVGVFSVDSSAV